MMNSQFETTNWTLILQAADNQSQSGRLSLERLCQAYWQPLYTWVRSTGLGHEDAQDRTQAFFQHLLSNDLHIDVHPSRGRFRTWLIILLKHFLLNEARHDHAQKRGGPERQDIGLEEAHDLIIDTATPDRAYERKWAHAVLANTLERLREDCTQTGQADRFEVLQGLLFDATKGEGATEEHAARLNLTLNAVKVALTRMRQRYRELLRVEVARLVEGPDQVDDEIAHLMQTLRNA